MFNNSKILAAIIFLSIFYSCYHKELNYSFNSSSGGVVEGTSFYYLANVREFQLPKGIRRCSDGGMSRNIRLLFGLFKTDTLTNSTILVTRLGEVVGWPSKYSTRLDKKGSSIAIGIVNVTQPDSINGIYLYSLKRDQLEKYSRAGAFPSLSSNGTQIAYCIKNKLVIDDFTSKTTLFSYLLNFDPVFVTWKSDIEIYLFLSNPFRVKVLNFSTGKTSDTGLKYIKNYDQEVDAEKINKFFRSSAQEPKVLLDRYR